MQKIVALSVTYAEIIAGAQCAQDMLYCKHVLECMGFGAVDLANNWKAGGCTRHMEIRMFFLYDLKEAGVLE
eukprot:1402785-Ditylum_brightwellii.AAC.1